MKDVDGEIVEHPILTIPERKRIKFHFNDKFYSGYANMVISSNLFMNGIKIFGHHPKDNSPQGIFCANGQCAQCTVIVNGKPVKSCMTSLKENMKIYSCDGLPELPELSEQSKLSKTSKSTENNKKINTQDPKILDVEVLIIGGGPAGLSAAKILGENGDKVLIVDDKQNTGGKLVLQTHKFFGSQEDVYAGKRGFEIGNILGREINQNKNIEVWLNSTALAVFSDKVVGVLYNNSEYILIHPKRLLIATGAREKMLIFPGDTLPGVYGAGAFQTLVNRDLVRPAKKIFIVGGGNVGLIAGYHAIQAGMEVIGLIEAMDHCGGYHVHESKLRRLDVPIYTRHTIISANSKDNNEVNDKDNNHEYDQDYRNIEVGSITIGKLDEKWHVIPGTERTFECDTILIAVGLNSVDEFYQKAKKYEMDVWIAGDAQDIAEASAAIFSGKIEAIKILNNIGIKHNFDLISLEGKAQRMKARPPAPIKIGIPLKETDIFPNFSCDQSIPCNPCTTVCPNNQIAKLGSNGKEYPYYKDNDKCTGCGRCVAICPGLAITLVDYKKDLEHPNVTFAYEIATSKLEKGQKVTVLDNSGVLGNFEVKQTRILKEYPKTQLITVSLPKDIAKRAIGIRTFSHITHESVEIYHKAPLADDAIVCRCERVTAGEIRAWIRKGVTDYNELKAITRTGMGACGGKTCTSLVQKLFREEGIPDKEITKGIFRPIFIEVSLGVFAGLTEEIELGSDRTNNEVKNEVKNETKNKMKEDDNP